MGFLKLTHERELELDLTKEAFRKGLEFNVGKSTTGSFFTDMFSTAEHKYKGIVDSTSFQLTFPKSIYRPSHFYPIINGKLEETESRLKVHIKVSSINWLAKILFFQLILVLVIVITLITGITNDLTDSIIMITMFLIVLVLISSIELYRMNKGVRIAMMEIEKDIWKIEKIYNCR